MTTLEFFLENGYVDVTDSEVARFPANGKCLLKSMNGSPQRWVKHKDKLDHIGSIPISEKCTIEHILKIIEASAFNAGCRWQKEQAEQYTHDTLEKEFKKFLKKSFPYVERKKK